MKGERKQPELGSVSCRYTSFVVKITQLKGLQSPVTAVLCSCNSISINKIPRECMTWEWTYNQSQHGHFKIPQYLHKPLQILYYFSSKFQTNMKSKSTREPCSTPSREPGFKAISVFGTVKPLYWELYLVAWAESSLSPSSPAHHNPSPGGTQRAPQQTVPKHTLTNPSAQLPSTEQACGSNKYYLRNSICHL